MMMQRLFQLMAEKSASDLYISAGTAIHINIQGTVIPVNQTRMEPDTIKKMAQELMNEEQREQIEQHLELNMSFVVPQVGNFRVNCFWQRGSMALVVRYITDQIPQLESLGLPPGLAEVVMEKRGLLLVVGSTGSGKSTTIAAMLDHRNSRIPGHILTIEDPVEFLFRHKKSIVNQREVPRDTKSYHEALRNALRQAPDCILIGEIRDRETMGMAINYALSGHLCLATLHANNSYHALNRIINLYPREARPNLLQDLAVSLKCIISQRLIRGADGKRVPAVEVLMNTRYTAELIEKGEVGEIKEAMEKSMTPGSQTFEQDLFRLIRENRVSMEEALANSDSPTNLSWLINNSDMTTTTPGAPPPPKKVEQTEPESESGASFSEFTLEVEDS